MNRINMTIKTTLLIICLFALPTLLAAQCNEYTKKECIPQLNPYTFNGQLNNAVLSEGETAELQLTFYKDQEYRILVEGENSLGKIQFQLYDTDYNLLYDNSDEDHTNLWDFMVESTDDFVIRVLIPNDEEKEKVESGCVSILVGFRAFGSRTIFK
ncbi:hypothetical protein L3049_14645 [Labilibaculum sp. DW002]|jgi:hypothetical protein|uniref:Uncharacterized protein n=1 Tax=Paralabilibaculum antarcticum TaxID=2912572 RepID=A0ABT5VV94_9BACT|nr:hypothetical protein [Labilibaculum sp. DW002]MDE5419236.1 hypothetical protein [Labilibaculum sp. DW002]